MSPTFHFFDAHIWSYLHVFGPLPRGLDMTQLRAPYPSCIFEVGSDDYHSESEEESVTLHVWEGVGDLREYIGKFFGTFP